MGAGLFHKKTCYCYKQFLRGSVGFLPEAYTLQLKVLFLSPSGFEIKMKMNFLDVFEELKGVDQEMDFSSFSLASKRYCKKMVFNPRCYWFAELLCLSQQRPKVYLSTSLTTLIYICIYQSLFRLLLILPYFLQQPNFSIDCLIYREHFKPDSNVMPECFH